MNNKTWLEGLNERQREAVEALDEPLLVLAGAGTGKTKTLTARLAHIIGNKIARPENILAVTFTNKAAGEMGERAQAMIGGEAGGKTYLPWLGTFHAIGAKMLRRHAEAAGLAPDFRILPQADSRQLVKQLLPQNEKDLAKQAGIIAHRIAAWKDKGLSPDDLNDETSFNQKVRTFYRRYETALREINAADFGDLLLKPLHILQTHKDILAQWQERFQHLLVDEYQDTNAVQYRWLKLLCGEKRTICCVGDDDQSIYGWRGARLENILNFQRDFPGAKIVKLEENYRSRKTIVAAAAGLIASNRDRMGKNLWTSAEQGQRLALAGARDEWDEARQLIALAAKENEQGVGWGEMAILVRTTRQIRVLRAVLVEHNIPHLLVRGTDFYELAEIRDIAAYLSLIANEGDDLAFIRALGAPPRGVGEVMIERLRELAQARGLSLAQAAALDETLLKEHGLARASKAFAGFIRALAGWRKKSKQMPLDKLTQLILEESGYLERLAQAQAKGGADEIDAARRMENLQDLQRIMRHKGFESPEAFLEHAALQGEENQEDSDKIKVMTIHAAKGLEFKNVFLPGWEEGILPHARAIEEGEREVEEERRLAHVALTRARERVWIFHAAQRGQQDYRRPSRFIGEIPQAMLASAAPVRRREIRFDEEESPAPSQHHSHGGAFRTPSPSTPAPAFRAPSPRRAKIMTQWRKGEKIIHGDLGEGMIEQVSGRNLTIRFTDGSTRKIIADFVARAR